MPQHDMDVSGGSGAGVRADLNAALQALASASSGATAPTTAYAYQFWADTTAGVLKQRNAANTSWIVRGPLAETLVVVRASNTVLGVGDWARTIIASGTWTQTFAGASTLGDGWFVEYRNGGTGVVTLDPNGSEQIDGATTVQLAPGETCSIYCNGAALYTIGRTAAAAQSQAATAFTSAGAAPSFTLAPVPALTTYAANQRFRVKFHAAGTGVATLNISALGAKSIKQYDAGGAKVAAVIVAGQLADVEYDGTDFVILDPLPPAAQVTLAVRQTVLSGVTDSNGRANFIGTGSGLSCNLAATASAVVMAFASGFGQSGAVDYVEQIAVDQAGYWSGLAANNLNYLHITRTAAGSLSAGSTLAPVQYGYTYDQTKQALLHFENSLLDDYGNAWINGGGVTFSTTAKFGGYSASFSASATGYIEAPFKLNLNAPFTIDFQHKRGATGGRQTLAGDGESSGANTGIGIMLEFNPSNQLVFSLFSGGTQYSVTGPTVTDTTSFHHIEACRSQDGKMWLFYDGAVYGPTDVSAVAINSLPSTSANPLRFGRLGAYAGYYLNGLIDDLRIAPYCRHTASFTAPVVAGNIAAPGESSDWFDLSTWTMKSVSAASTAAGSSPTFSSVNRLYVGEAMTGLSSVSSVVGYAYMGRAIVRGNPTWATSSVTNMNHNVGAPVKVSMRAECLSYNNGWSSGDLWNIGAINNTQSGYDAGVGFDSKAVRLIVAYSAGLYMPPKGGGVQFSLASYASSWACNALVERAF